MAAKSEIKALTGLRGIAAMMVAVYHVNPELSARSAPGIGTILGKGYIWVDLFFVLSGFVLALNYAHRFAEGISINGWGDFLIRSIARIYPLYVAVILAGGVIMVAGYGKAFAMPLLDPRMHHPVTLAIANLLMIQSCAFAPTSPRPACPLPPDWAISP